MKEHAILETSATVRKTLYVILRLLRHLFRSLVIKQIVKPISVLADIKSPCWSCVLHIVSNLVFVMILIYQVVSTYQVTKIRNYGFLLCTYRNSKYTDI